MSAPNIDQLQATDTGSIVTTHTSTLPIPEEWRHIEARPLNNPDVLAVKSKNTNLAFRWVQYKLAGGRSYQEAVAKGFRKATPQDCEPIMQWDEKARCFHYDDVMLMCLPKEQYDGALAHNWIRANARVRQFIEAGARELTALASGAARGKIEGYVPRNVQIENEGQDNAGLKPEDVR